MSKETKKVNIKPLISVSPKFYRKITKDLENKYHIHSYDLQALAAQKEEGIHIILRFGEQFSNEKEHFFSKDDLEKGKAMDTFIEEVGEECKQVMIDDYFKKMAP